MITRILVVATCIFFAMVAVKDGRVLRHTGLTASCAVVQRATDGSELDACRPGKLEGSPNLTGRGCQSAGVADRLQYWRCPAQTAAAYRP